MAGSLTQLNLHNFHSDDTSLICSILAQLKQLKHLRMACTYAGGHNSLVRLHQFEFLRSLNDLQHLEIDASRLFELSPGRDLPALAQLIGHRTKLQFLQISLANASCNVLEQFSGHLTSLCNLKHFKPRMCMVRCSNCNRFLDDPKPAREQKRFTSTIASQAPPRSVLQRHSEAMQPVVGCLHGQQLADEQVERLTAERSTVAEIRAQSLQCRRSRLLQALTCPFCGADCRSQQKAGAGGRLLSHIFLNLRGLQVPVSGLHTSSLCLAI